MGRLDGKVALISGGARGPVVDVEDQDAGAGCSTLLLSPVGRAQVEIALGLRWAGGRTRQGREQHDENGEVSHAKNRRGREPGWSTD